MIKLKIIVSILGTILGDVYFNLAGFSLTQMLYLNIRH